MLETLVSSLARPTAGFDGAHAGPGGRCDPAPAGPRPRSDSAPMRRKARRSPITRTGSRAARVGAFALETWSRMLVDGAHDSAEARARELSWVAENMSALHGLRTIVGGAVPHGPCVLVANHITYFDPLVIASQLPLTAVAKREVSSWPLVGELCRRLGVLFVDRDDPHSGARVLRSALRALEHDVPVLVFPEGTTTRGDYVLRFKRGIFGAAQRAERPIVPVALRYERADAAWVGDDAFLPHYVRTMAKPCTRVSVEFLPQLAVSGSPSPDALAEAAQRAIASALSRPKQARFPGPRDLGDGLLGPA